jgi:WD40 repeat protein
LPAHTVYGFSMSRDGKHLAYTDAAFAYGIERLAINPANGRGEGAPIEIFQTSEAVGTMSSSSDGALLIFDSQGSSQEDIHLVHADGSGLRKITDDAPRDRAASFGPDGKRIVFQSDRGGTWDLWSIGADGSTLTQLTHGSGFFEPLWSPDGRRVAASNGREVDVWDVDSKGTLSNPKKLPAPEDGRVPVATSWTSDGRLLVSLNKKEFSGGFDAAVFSFDTGAYRVLDRPVDLIGGPWSLPPNRAILSTQEGLLVTNLDGNDRIVLVPRPNSGDYQVVAPSQDGKVLYLSHLHDNADIWMATPP